MISRLYFALQAQQYKNHGGDDHSPPTSATPFALPASPAVQRVFHSQPCQPRRESSTLSIDSHLTTTPFSLRLWKDTYTKMGKCYGGMPGCDGKARNIESWCGMCTRAKRALGHKVVNKGSPHNAAQSKSLKKRPHERSAHEQSLCDRYALRCMSQCTQCLWQCIRRADTRICECTRSVILCAHIRVKKRNQTSHKAEKEALRKSRAGEFLTDQESRGIARYSHASPALPRLHMY